MQLTTEQQELVENGLWVVNAVLKRLNQRGNEDLRQEAMLYLCELATKWNVAKGRKWTSYAYQRVYFFALHGAQKGNTIRQREELRSVLPDSIAPSLDDDARYAVEIVEELYKRLNEVQREVLYLRVQGCTHKDISAKLGISYKRVTQIETEIKHAAEKLRAEWTSE